MAGNTLLLDTNVLLTALIAPDTVPTEVQAELSDPVDSLLFSAASISEIPIQRSLGQEPAISGRRIFSSWHWK